MSSHHHLASTQRRSYGRPYLVPREQPPGPVDLGPAFRLCDTINPFKEARRQAVWAEVQRRLKAGVATDYRLSAFDIFNWLQTETPEGESWPIIRLGFRETYRKAIGYLRRYYAKATPPYFFLK